MAPLELRKLSVAELHAKLQETQAELRDATRSLAAGELANPRVITRARRDIARLKTVLASTMRAEQTKEKDNA